MEILAEIALDEIRAVVANDSSRSSFTVVSRDGMLALDRNLTVTGRWPAGGLEGGLPATAPGRGLALIAGDDEVRLLDRQGKVRWRYQHMSWEGDRGGCTWFDRAGEPHAVVPAGDGEGCLVVRLDLDSGRLLAEAPFPGWPGGAPHPVHHPNGWVGLFYGESGLTFEALWIRSRRQPGGSVRLETLAAGWEDEILCDVDATGAHVLTMSHPSGPVFVRSFPDLRVRRTIELPAWAACWHPPGCFAGDLILARVSYGLLAFRADGTVDTLNDQWDGWVVPAAYRTWLTVTGTRIRHAKISGWPSGPPPETIPLF